MKSLCAKNVKIHQTITQRMKTLYHFHIKRMIHLQSDAQRINKIISTTDAKSNWFLGIPIDKKHQKWFENTKQTLPQGCRIHDSNDLHITIAFLGALKMNLPPQVSVELIKHIIHYMENNIHKFSFPIYLPFDHGMTFPTWLDESKMLSVGYSIDDKDNIIRDFIFCHRNNIFNMIEQSIKKYSFNENLKKKEQLLDNIANEKRVASPHVTIARPPYRGDKSVRQLMIDWTKSKQHVPCKDSFKVPLNKIALYTWSGNYPEQPLFEQVYCKQLF